MIREEYKFYYPRESNNVKNRPEKKQNCNIRRLKREMQRIREKIEYLSLKNPKNPEIEKLQETLQTGQSRVEDAFRILNQEGVLSQAVHHTAHDTNRNPIAYCDISGWASDIYYIYRE